MPRYGRFYRKFDLKLAVLTVRGEIWTFSRRALFITRPILGQKMHMMALKIAHDKADLTSCSDLKLEKYWASGDLKKSEPLLKNWNENGA